MVKLDDYSREMTLTERDINRLIDGETLEAQLGKMELTIELDGC